MKKIIISLFAAATSLAAGAQETYEIANIGTQDLNGTARYVGMGGAMEALGADISTMSTNPAGIGLFRRSQLTGTLGLVAQQESEGWQSYDKTNVSFDQLGLVVAMPTGDDSFFNFGFGYRKSRNFNQILSMVDVLDGASQSKVFYDKMAGGYITNEDSRTYSQLDVLNHETLYVGDDGKLFNPVRFANGTATRFDGYDYEWHRGASGYIGEYDFNISGNIDNRYYLGFTLGLHDVNYRANTLYDERMLPNTAGLETLTFTDRREIDGTGVDVKFGFIFRPVEESPFRIGLYVNSPIWYDLTSYNYTRMFANDTEYADPVQGEQEYAFKTPWKFGVSLGHTIENFIALGATYEYADYGTTQARIKYPGYTYDTWSDTEPDDAMNASIKSTLKGVHTLKVGAELKPSDELSVRMGYNFVSPMYQKDAYRDVVADSYGTMYSSTVDYTNWKATHRFTVGLGYRFSKRMALDAAYQFSAQKGQFLPFPGSDDDNLPYDKDITNKRNTWQLTMAYTF